MQRALSAPLGVRLALLNRPTTKALFFELDPVQDTGVCLNVCSNACFNMCLNVCVIRRLLWAFSGVTCRSVPRQHLVNALW